jgi:hypothetical protein
VRDAPIRTKAEKLLAVYARFAQGIANIPDPRAQDIYRVAAGAHEFVAEARLRQPKPTNSQIAAGLEQGLREMPGSVREVGAKWRSEFARALHQSITIEYPEFLALDAQRLAKIMERGRIRTESEFYLVRHRIDIAEGEPELTEELEKLYALVGAYEARV